MSKFIAVLGTTLVLLPSARHPGSQEDPDLSQTAALLAARALEAGTQGVSIAVTFGGETFVSEGWGKSGEHQAARGDSTYHVGPLTDAFLACVALQLVEADELSLDDTLCELLPELCQASAAGDEGQGPGTTGGMHTAPPAEDFEQISLAQLLTQTSGLPSYEDFPADPAAGAPNALEALRALARMPLEFVPGSCQQFSDTNALVLGCALERKTGQRVPELLEARIFAPLGMEATGYRADGAVRELAYDVHELSGGEMQHPGRPHPFDADRLCSSAPDLVRWMRALVDGELLDPPTFEQLVAQPFVELGGALGRGHGLDVTRLENETCYSVGGGAVGQRVHVAHYPGRDLTIAVVAQGERTEVQSIARSIARTVFGFAAPGLQDLPIGAQEAEPYVGEYMVGCNLCLVTFADARLRISTPDQRSVELAYQGRHVFLARDDSSFSLTFHLSEGRANSITLVESGAESFGRRVR